MSDPFGLRADAYTTGSPEPCDVETIREAIRRAESVLPMRIWVAAGQMDRFLSLFRQEQSPAPHFGVEFFDASFRFEPREGDVLFTSFGMFKLGAAAVKILKGVAHGR